MDDSRLLASLQMLKIVSVGRIARFAIVNKAVESSSLNFDGW